MFWKMAVFEWYIPLRKYFPLEMISFGLAYFYFSVVQNPNASLITWLILVMWHYIFSNGKYSQRKCQKNNHGIISIVNLYLSYYYVDLFGGMYSYRTYCILTINNYRMYDWTFCGVINVCRQCIGLSCEYVLYINAHGCRQYLKYCN